MSIKSALHILSSASKDDLQEVQEQVLTTINIIRKKLRQLLVEDPVTALLDSLLRKLQCITKFAKQSVDAVVGKPSSKVEDCRILHFQAAGRKGGQTKYLWALLACRSLAIEYDEWERHRYGTSRVNALVSDLAQAGNKQGHIQEFVKGRFQDEKFSTTVISYGIKVLVTEGRYEHSGISCLLAFVYTQHFLLPYSDMKKFLDGLSMPKHAEVAEFARSQSKFVEACQDRYDSKKVKHENIGCYRLFWTRYISMADRYRCI
jgi:hypothetical protein